MEAHVTQRCRLFPGDLIISRCTMRAWETDTERGYSGIVVCKGEVGLVVQTWDVGKHTRLRVMIDDQVAVFSHESYCVELNWDISVRSTPIILGAV